MSWLSLKCSEKRCKNAVSIAKECLFRKAFGSRGSQPNFVADKLFFKNDQVGYEGLAEEFVSMFSNSVYLPMQVQRCKEVLLAQLSETEGWLWQSV